MFSVWISEWSKFLTLPEPEIKADGSHKDQTGVDRIKLLHGSDGMAVSLFLIGSFMLHTYYKLVKPVWDPRVRNRNTSPLPLHWLGTKRF